MDDGLVGRLFLLVAFPRTWGGLQSLRSLAIGRWLKVGDVGIFFVWLWTPFGTAFCAFKAFGLASALGEMRLLTPSLAFDTFFTVFVKSSRQFSLAECGGLFKALLHPVQLALC